jgi:chaperone required for assembly of F1-ATPase
MAEWKMRRFWREAGVMSVAGGFEVRLDGRPVRTPAKAPLVVPGAALANAIAAEWDAQDEAVKPLTMPLTRLANSAVDTVAVEHAAVAERVAAYGGTDLVCYRAEAPDGLVARQAAAWDPLVDWAAVALAAPLTIGTGVVYIAQPDASLDALTRVVSALDFWDLAALHELVALSGSLVIGLAAIRTDRPREALWAASRVDEDWQQDLWGVDEEAAELAAVKARAFLDAARFFDLRHAG